MRKIGREVVLAIRAVDAECVTSTHGSPEGRCEVRRERKGDGQRLTVAVYNEETLGCRVPAQILLRRRVDSVIEGGLEGPREGGIAVVLSTWTGVNFKGDLVKGYDLRCSSPR